MKTRIVYGTHKRYYVNGREVTEIEFHRRCPSKSLRGAGGRLVAPQIRADTGDWSERKSVLKRHYRDPGRVVDGQYCPQAARFAGDPQAVFRSRTEYVDWAKRQGKIVEVG